MSNPPCWTKENTMKKVLAQLTRMMLNAVDKRLLKTERALWQRQAWFMAKKIEAERRAR